MNKKIKSMAVWLLACMMTVLRPYGGMVSLAASGQISFTDPSVMAGREVNINMEVKAVSAESLDRSVVMLSYDTGMLEFLGGANASGGAGSLQVIGSASDGDDKVFRTTLRFKALKPGETKITVADQEVYDSNGQMVEISQIGSSSITIAAQASASEDASLSGLRVAPGELSPAFSSEVLEYRVDVGMDVDKVAVSADLSNANAKVVVNGGSDLQAGENTVTCKVTAEDGKTVRSYTIVVNKGEGAAASSEPSAEEEGVEFHTTSKTITILPLDEGVEVPDGFVEEKIKMNGQPVTSWVRDATGSDKFYLLYGRNESGDKGFYLYDSLEKTMQRYHESVDTNVPQDQYLQEVQARKDLQKDYSQAMMLIWILLGVSILLFIVLVVILVKMTRRPGSGGNGPWDGRDQEDEDLPISEEERYLRGGEPDGDAGLDADDLEDEDRPDGDYDQELYETEDDGLDADDSYADEPDVAGLGDGLDEAGPADGLDGAGADSYADEPGAYTDEPGIGLYTDGSDEPGPYADGLNGARPYPAEPDKAGPYMAEPDEAGPYAAGPDEPGPYDGCRGTAEADRDNPDGDDGPLFEILDLEEEAVMEGIREDLGRQISQKTKKPDSGEDELEVFDL